MTTETKVTHAPGPLSHYVDDVPEAINPDIYIRVECAGDICKLGGGKYAVRIANARLLAAAYSSYDKHCGAKAVQCAEGDLLGELLEALELLMDEERRDRIMPIGAAWDKARAVLAKAKGTNQ